MVLRGFIVLILLGLGTTFFCHDFTVTPPLSRQKSTKSKEGDPNSGGSSPRLPASSRPYYVHSQDIKPRLNSNPATTKRGSPTSRTKKNTVAERLPLDKIMRVNLHWLLQALKIEVKDMAGLLHQIRQSSRDPENDYPLRMRGLSDIETVLQRLDTKEPVADIRIALQEANQTAMILRSLFDQLGFVSPVPMEIYFATFVGLLYEGVSVSEFQVMLQQSTQLPHWLKNQLLAHIRLFLLPRSQPIDVERVEKSGVWQTGLFQLKGRYHWQQRVCIAENECWVTDQIFDPQGLRFIASGKSRPVLDPFAGELRGVQTPDRLLTISGDGTSNTHISVPPVVFQQFPGGLAYHFNISTEQRNSEWIFYNRAVVSAYERYLRTYRQIRMVFKTLAYPFISSDLIDYMLVGWGQLGIGDDPVVKVAQLVEKSQLLSSKEKKIFQDRYSFYLVKQTVLREIESLDSRQREAIGGLTTVSQIQEYLKKMGIPYQNSTLEIEYPPDESSPNAYAPVGEPTPPPSVIYANRVTEYSPIPMERAFRGYFDPHKILGKPDGWRQVVSLGFDPSSFPHQAGGSITVGMGTKSQNFCIIDGVGADFLVIENVFNYVAGTFNEALWVAVSQDNRRFFRFPHQLNTQHGLSDPARYMGFAGIYEGGDLFDLQTLKAANPYLPVNFRACYIKLIDGGTQVSDADSESELSDGSGADIDAIIGYHFRAL